MGEETYYPEAKHVFSMYLGGKWYRLTADSSIIPDHVYPVDVTDLLRVSDNDMVMPPKSTWFEPKLGSGLFMHRLK